MKKSTKSALLSGLVFPGIGHLVLKQYLRGLILAFFALTASTVIVTVAVRQALTLIDRVSLGEIPTDAETIAMLAADSMSDSAGLLVNTSVLVLGICWLFGIVDSYRLGMKQE